jgi:peptidoglycan/LPS O-acetylase OafA/YrhL
MEDNIWCLSMANSKKIFNILSIIWVIILILLWFTYSWWSNWLFDIFTWMWIAIAWSALGGIVGSIVFSTKSKRNLLIVVIVWGIVLIFFWLNYFLEFIPGTDMTQWLWVTIICTIGVVTISLGILTMKLLKKTQW